jgi:hypothetical protein
MRSKTREGRIFVSIQLEQSAVRKANCVSAPVLSMFQHFDDRWLTTEAVQFDDVKNTPIFYIIIIISIVIYI